jgi:hypothetical protein
MSSVSSSFKDVPRRQYITSQYFDTNIFQYSTYIDSSLATRGRLIKHPSATPNNCVAGNILRENGKKLHSGTHPDLKDPVTNLQYTYLVGVYDVVTGISGFINPNAPYFAVLNTDKSYQDDIAAYQVDASQHTIEASTSNFNYNNTGNPILGPPVNTAGDITTLGYVGGAQLHGADLIHTGGYIVAGPDSLITNPSTGVPILYSNYTILAQSNITTLANINASNGTVTGSNLVALSNLTVNTGNITLTAGRLILNANNTGIANMASGSIDGSFRKLTVASTACRTTSRVFLTYAGQNNVGVLSAEAIASNSFQIVSSSTTDAGTVQWLVVN